MLTLADLLSPQCICWPENVDKAGALRVLLDLLSKTQSVHDPAALKQAILSREVLMPTGVGYGVAVPHAKVASVESFVLSMAICDPGIDYGGFMDEKPVRLIVMIAGPDSEQEGYLKLLSTLMKFIKSEKGQIITCRSADSIVDWARAYPLDIPASFGA